MSALASSLQAWFTDRLVRERNASPHTIASYRDTIRLLLTYASGRLGVEPSRLGLGQLDAPLIGAFLDHLETDRGCSPRTRNTRLAAIRTFYRYLPAAPPRTRPHDRPRPADRTQAPRARAGHLPHRAGARRAHRRPSPLDVDRPSRPHDHHPARPDRTARL
jgi:site-specific recombinase XerC